MAGQVNYDQLEDPNQFAVTQPNWWDQFFRSVDNAIDRAFPDRTEYGETSGVSGNITLTPEQQTRVGKNLWTTILLAVGITALAVFAFTRK